MDGTPDGTTWPISLFIFQEDLYLVETLLPALEADTYDRSHPLNAPVTHQGSINDIFDTITYSKVKYH